MFPKVTVDLWSSAKECDLLHQINAEQALFDKKTIETATKEATDMITQDSVIPQLQLKAAVTAMIRKELNSSKAQAQKKSLADSKNQELNATRNGPNSNKSSKRKER